MTKYLRAHPRLTLLVSAGLLLGGGFLLFFQDPGDLSGTASILSLVAFVAWSVGLVGIMILVFRPISLTRDEAANWELTRLHGKGHFIRQFIWMGFPFIIGILAFAFWDWSAGRESSILTVSILVIVFVAVFALAGYEFWKTFERQHSIISKRASEAEIQEEEEKV